VKKLRKGGTQAMIAHKISKKRRLIFLSGFKVAAINRQKSIIYV
jgi:hypothetical protein